MGQQLINILNIQNVPPATPTDVAHGLHVDGRGVTPDLIIPDHDTFTITADDTNVTITNNGASPAHIHLLCIHWHSFLRVFGAEGVDALTPQPFVPNYDQPAPASVGAVLAWGNSNISASADTRFLDFGYARATAPTTGDTGFRAPRDGTARNLRVRHNNAIGNGNDVVYTLHVNGAPTALTATLATGAVGDAQDLVNSVAVNSGDLLELVATKPASLGNGNQDAMAVLEFA